MTANASWHIASRSPACGDGGGPGAANTQQPRMPALALRNVCRYRRQPGDDGAPRRVPVLREVSAVLPAGTLCSVLGPSGSGKSTLLRLLNRLDDPDSGEILLDGLPLQSLPVQALRRRIVLVGQQPAVLPGSVAENLAYGPRLQGLPLAEVEERVREALDGVGLGRDFLARPAQALSVGQLQRVCLARALALRPEILLLDEPTAALDAASAEVILALVSDLHRRLGLSVIYVTHRVKEARALGGMALLLVDGAVVEMGEVGEVSMRLTPSASLHL